MCFTVTVPIFLVLSITGVAQELAGWRATLDKANGLRDSGSPEAESVYLKAVAEAGQTATDGPMAVASVWNDLAIWRSNHGQYREAEGILRRALAIYDANPGAPPLDVAAALHNLACACRRLGCRGEAESLHLRSIAMIEHAGNPAHGALVPALNALGWIYLEQGRIGEAEPLLRRALRIGENLGASSVPDVISSLIGISEIQRQSGDYGSARQSAIRAFRKIETTSPQGDVKNAPVFNQIARIDFELGRLRSAGVYWKRALDIIEKQRGPEHSDALVVLTQLAFVARAERRFEEAEGLLLRVVHAAGKAGTQVHLAVGLHQLALLYAIQNRHALAEPLYRQSLAITEREVGPHSAELATCMADLARSQLAMGKVEEAELFTRKAIAIFEPTSRTRHPFFLGLLKFHAQTLNKLNRKKEARQVAERAKVMQASGGIGRSADTIDISELEAVR